MHLAQSTICAVLMGVAVAAMPFKLVDPVNTPFLENGDLNLEVVPAIANVSSMHHMEVVLLGGSNGEWSSMSVEERVSLMDAWADALNSLSTYRPSLMFHVGSLDLRQAVVLAEEAEKRDGVDSILAVAPGVIFTPDSTYALASHLRVIAAAAPSKPFYYYHFPGLYHVDAGFSMVDLIASMTNKSNAATYIPTLRGIKYIDSNVEDYIKAVAIAESNGHPVEWIVEAQLTTTCRPYGCVGTPTHPMTATELRAAVAGMDGGDFEAAAAAQRKYYAFGDAQAGCGSGVGVPKEVFRLFYGVDLGPPRPPQSPLTAAQKAQLKKQLQDAGFLPK